MDCAEHTVRVLLLTGEVATVPTLVRYHDSVWCVVAEEHLDPRSPLCAIVHVPTGCNVACVDTSDEAINLCRVLRDVCPDFAADASFGARIPPPPPELNEALALRGIGGTFAALGDLS